MRPLKKRQSRASSRAKWLKTSSVLDDHNHEETNATTNEDGSRTRRTKQIATIEGIKTQTGDKTRNHLNTTLPWPHHPTRMSQSPWTSTVPGPLREEDAQ